MYTQEKLEDFGMTLGARLGGGEVIELIGDVGAGKTTLTRAIARGMDIHEPMQSPTFTIVNRYQSPQDTTLAHYDFYRLTDAGMMREELREALEDSETVVVIEWGDIVADVLPDDRVTIRLSTASENERNIMIEAAGERASVLVEGLMS